MGCHRPNRVFVTRRHTCLHSALLLLAQGGDISRGPALLMSLTLPLLPAQGSASLPAHHQDFLEPVVRNPCLPQSPRAHLFFLGTADVLASPSAFLLPLQVSQHSSHCPDTGSQGRLQP